MEYQENLEIINELISLGLEDIAKEWEKITLHNFIVIQNETEVDNTF
jgi:hypothetical protein